MSNINDIIDWKLYKSMLEQLLQNMGFSKDLLDCKQIENKYHIKGRNRSQIIEQYKDDDLTLVLCLYYFACEDLRDKTDSGIPEKVNKL